LGRKAAVFGREQKVDVVLADLAFEAVVAGRVAAWILGVPLLVSVHDDPVNRLKAKEYPDWLVKLFEANVMKTMKAARRCGVISKYMGEVYQELFDVETVSLYIGVDKDRCLPAALIDQEGDFITIGSVGSMLSAENWQLLIEAVRILNQRHGSDRFRILHIGDLSDRLPTPREVKATGWLPQQEFLNQLSRIDMGFLNWWFDPRYAKTSRTSFPLKTHSYIQAQRPMVALGPPKSTVIRFVDEYDCGEICTVPSAINLAEKIDRLTVYDRYREALEGVKRLKDEFSRAAFFENFEYFIDVSDG
jgi:hypothetical protein